MICKAWLCVGFTVLGLNAAQPPRLGLTPAPVLKLRLVEQGVPLMTGTQFTYELEGSSDLKSWRSLGLFDPALVAGAAPDLSAGPGEHMRFFRLRSGVTNEPTVTVEGDRLGYNRVFAGELQHAGFLSVAEFQARYSVTNQYLPRISWDPARAKYWNLFREYVSANPERDLLNKNGFFVSERFGGANFAQVFYQLFLGDKPVFISTDALLHAWHCSYDRMLMELEETVLSPALRAILNALSAELPRLQSESANLPLGESLQDADYLLTVARSLLGSQQTPSPLGQDARVAVTLAAVKSERYYQEFQLFGDYRPFDFSQFAIRGHYAQRASLGFYFQAFMWLARADLHVFDPNPARRKETLRELGTAVVLSELMNRSGQVQAWSQLEKPLRAFVGAPDNLTFPQLAALLSAAKLVSLTNITSLDVLAGLQQRILAGDLGEQAYDVQGFYSPMGPQQTQLPRSFAFAGQAFVPDGWLVSKTTFDRVLWNEELPGVIQGKVIRRRSTGLDVAFGVLDNRQIVPELVANLTNRNGVKFRDGLPYQHNLAAARETINRQTPESWQDSIYTQWLHTLRALSEPTTDARFPEAMRTRAWAMKSLNTQLASWTQLRHDTILYAKQPYSGPFACEYPAGFIEPVPEFWRRLADMAEFTANVLGQLEPGSGNIGGFGPSLRDRHFARINFCREFAATASRLRQMAEKELAQQPFSADEIFFVRSTVNDQHQVYGGFTYDGWYPRCFYQDYTQPGAVGPDNPPTDIIKLAGLVTDVYTATPDPVVGDPGGVLHQAVGPIDLLVIAVDNGPDRMIYAGPTLSHYEFTTTGVSRLADKEWQDKLISRAGFPPRPPWTSGYLVPR